MTPVILAGNKTDYYCNVLYLDHPGHGVGVARLSQTDLLPHEYSSSSIPMLTRVYVPT